jgi:hypothetical protein
MPERDAFGNPIEDAQPSSIDYLVLFNVLDGPQWSAYFTDGAAFQGDAHGKIVRRIQ